MKSPATASQIAEYSTLYKFNGHKNSIATTYRLVVTTVLALVVAIITTNALEILEKPF